MWGRIRLGKGPICVQGPVLRPLRLGGGAQRSSLWAVKEEEGLGLTTRKGLRPGDSSRGASGQLPLGFMGCAHGWGHVVRMKGCTQSKALSEIMSLL